MNGDASLLFHITFNMHKQYSIIVKLHGANDKLPLILHINNTAAENMATRGARASVIMVFTWLSQNIPRKAMFIIVLRTAMAQS